MDLDLTPYLPPAWVVWLVGGVCALSVTLTVVFAGYAIWKGRPRSATPATLEDWLTRGVATIATGVSAEGMWRFTRDVLKLDGLLQAALFAFIELSMVTEAVRARRNMREHGSAGLDGIAVWALACLTAVLSSMDAKQPAEAVFRLAAPLVAAWMWERGMRLERRRQRGKKGVHWRITPERVLVWLGLAEARDRTASEVDAHRRLKRAAKAAKRVHQLRTEKAKERKVTRALAKRDRLLDLATEHTDLATNPRTQGILLDLLRTMGGAEDLSVILASARAPWRDLDHPAITGSVRHSEAVELAAALDRNTATRLRAEELEPVAEYDRSATEAATGRGGEHRPLEVAGDLVPIVRDSRSWLTALVPWSRPGALESHDHDGDQLPVVETVAEPVANGAPDDDVDATDTRPVADREKPNDQDRRRAIRFYIGRAKKLNPPSKRVLAKWTGFSETWALGCIQEGQQQMTEQGWTFDDRGTPTPPLEVAEPVATTPLPATVNGDQS
ncbi:hypothetical protein [Nonomuraea guangzhouensis]|uniref:DUF2637 domain-containing protein n=1 Tax=Nonomuraea guangzhouensis TaxID=1291555 RepID=A0ABW4GXI9_9ACTN|nr:hypothetical protein [Nonomuraea guangzhouensis]